jgi:cytochrome c-type protein NapC|tara:strand:- start:94 stop:651 length:558 start_codon:yes stop_codon:yes gene_type:complete
LIGNEKKQSKLVKTIISGTFLLAIVLGVSFAILGSVVTEQTNSTEFCTSCHSMQWVTNEWKESYHYKNASGVRAECADCHVPHSLGPKMVAKLLAAKDVWGEVTGVIDTKEKFESHRWVMANRVWDKMKATDSRECRSCHAFESMDTTEQTKFSRKKHAKAELEGKTCIDCHRGIAHEMPTEPRE